MKTCGLCFTEPCACVPSFKQGMARRCRQYFEKLIEPMRETARAHGYALTVHGSLARDIDVVAVPWTDEAVLHDVLVAALVRTVEEHNGGFAHVQNTSDENYLRPTERPHGRLVWSIHLGGGPWIDLGVMPRRMA